MHVSHLLSHCLKPKSRFIIPSFSVATMQRFPREECSLVANCQNCPDVTSPSWLKRSSTNEKVSFSGNFLRLHLGICTWFQARRQMTFHANWIFWTCLFKQPIFSPSSCFFHLSPTRRWLKATKVGKVITTADLCLLFKALTQLLIE